LGTLDRAQNRALKLEPGETDDMATYFSFGGVEYRVSGGFRGAGGAGDGGGDGMIVSREDGTPIPGAEMHPGMVQTGLPVALERAAKSALGRARPKRRS
jgi:hypothetical protein